MTSAGGAGGKGGAAAGDESFLGAVSSWFGWSVLDEVSCAASQPPFAVARLCRAAKNNDAATVRKLANARTVNQRGWLGWAPLHKAAEAGACEALAAPGGLVSRSAPGGRDADARAGRGGRAAAGGAGKG